MSTAVDIGTLIVRTPGTLGGRPRIADHRIGVRHIAIFSQMGLTPEKIVAEKYPQLSLAEVHAALAYYHANRDEIDTDIEDDARSFREGAAAAREAGQGISHPS